MKLNAVATLATGPLLGTWFRAVQLRFWQSLLATAHTKTIPGRFNAGNPTQPGFEILYFTENQQVALFEVEALLGSPLPGRVFIPNPSPAWAIINVQVRLDQAVDLTLRAARAKIDTTVQELTGDWLGYSLRNTHPQPIAPHWTNVPTQKLGHELHGIPNVEGFVTYSARVPTQKNLIVFPQKLGPNSFVKFQNPITGKIDSIAGSNPVKPKPRASGRRRPGNGP